jgi:dihydroorotase
VQHISTAEGVDIIRKAVQTGSLSERKIHAEACPHHFTLTQEALTDHGTLVKMNPPLRLESDRQAVIEGLKDGTIDLIATDHAPHSSEEKARELTSAPSGILGLQTAFALGVTRLVKPGHLTLMELLKKMSLNPARLYGFDAGHIYEGGPADITVFDPDEEWFFSGDLIRSKSVNSPFVGWKLTGRVRYTICGGKVVFKI